MDYSLLEDQYTLECQFLQAPEVDDSLLTAGGEGAVAGRGLGACQVVVGLPEVPDYLELALGVALVYHHSAVQRADNE